MNDDATRRQLRFSVFLQAFAVLMLGTTAVVRLFAFGFDAVTAILIIALVVVIGAAVFTWRKMQSLRSVD